MAASSALAQSAGEGHDPDAGAFLLPADSGMPKTAAPWQWPALGYRTVAALGAALLLGLSVVSRGVAPRSVEAGRATPRPTTFDLPVLDTCRHVCPGRPVGGKVHETGMESGHLEVTGLWQWSQMSFTAPGAEANEITIVHFNDCYQIAPVAWNGDRRGGLAQVMAVIKREQTKNPNRFLVLAPGDYISPSTLSGMYKGKQMIDVLNMLPIDAASLGNHEFDFGVETLKNRISESKFPWLISNLINKTTKEPIAGCQQYVIKDMDVTPSETGEPEKVKVCIFAVAYDVRGSIHFDRDLIGFEDPIEIARKDVKHLRETEKCQVVVALTHQFAVDDCRFSKEMGKDVDVIIGAHDHTTMLETTCGNAPYLKTDSDAKTIWTTTLRIGKGGRVMNMAANVEPLTKASPADASVADKIRAWEEKAAEELKVPVGCTDSDLDALVPHIRQGETNLGDLIADSVRYIRRHHKHTIDAAIINGGGIRGGRIWPKGNLTMSEIRGFHPFGNEIVDITVNGSALKQYFENTLSCYKDRCGKFLQVSGLKYKFSQSTLKLKLLTKEDGTPIMPWTKLNIAIPDFAFIHAPALAGSPLYHMNRMNDGLPMTYYIAEYIRRLQREKGGKCIDPQVDGRITVLP